MASDDLILIDDLPFYRRVALIRDGVLDQLWIDDAAASLPQPGAVLAARVVQVFPQHDRVNLDLGAAYPNASARLRPPSTAAIKPGQMLAVTVAALPREGKPLQVKIKGDMAAADLPSSPGMIAPAPDALTLAKLAASPEAAINHDATGDLWARYEIDAAIDAACQSIMPLPEGGVMQINTPPGAAVIDGDSGDSRLAPYELAMVMVPHAMRQLRLRRIGGPIVIDFPRITPDEQKHIHNAMKAEAKRDPLKPALHGFTRGGLYTMARPWRGQMLAEDQGDKGAEIGRAALREIRRHHATHRPGGLTLRLHPEGYAWLHHDGQAAWDILRAGLAFLVEFRSDDGVADVLIDENGHR